MTFSTHIAFCIHLTHSRVAVMARCAFVNEARLSHSLDKATSAYLCEKAFEVLVTVTIATTCLMQVIMAEFMFNDANQRFWSQFLFNKGIYLDISRLQKITTTARTQMFVISDFVREFAVKRRA